jgi:uncharacterized RDD family membrane protein YckC
MPDSGLSSNKSPGSVQDRGGPEVVVAGFWRRTLAALLDLAIIAPVLVGLVWLSKQLTGYTLPSVSKVRLETILEMIIGGEGMLYSMVAMVMVMVVLYLALFLLISGATPGLKVLKLRVINVYGQTPELWRVALRCFGFVLSCGLMGLGFFWIVFDREKRGLQDWVAGTYVIHQGS